MKTKILAATAIVAILALTALTFSSHHSQAQEPQQSANLATFAALMQYIRSDPTPSDVKANNVAQLALFDGVFTDIYITGFITPFTGETPEQVKARLQSVPEEDRFTAVMVESYRLSSNPLLLDIMHILLAQYYVDFFTTADLVGASAYLKRAEIRTLADGFDSANYAISAPTETGTSPPPTRFLGKVESANLAKFAALMKYIRSDPTPSDVKANNVAQLALFDGVFTDIYITGFITPFTGETPEQVKARLRSVPQEDRFTAVMVESYRLASNPLLLDIMHILLAQYYVDFFTTTDLGGASAYLNRDEFTTLADAFDSTDYAIPAPSAADTGSPETDRAALVALYNATDGPNWRWNFNWLSDEPLSEWPGVTTDDDGRVTELDLGENQLTGMVPPELGDLSRLEWLSLTRNQLSGPIPPELGKLSKLEFLSLSSNHLTGDIPTELGDMSELTQVYLWGNDLSGAIPTELGDLSNLRELILHNNGLTGAIPPELGKLANLEDLLLAGNDLSGAIPSELGDLSNLEFLSLAGNDLTGCIPNVLGDTWSNDLSELGLSFCAPRASDPADKAILEAFYRSNGGSNWSTTTNWLSDQPMSLWYGVATDSDGRVIGFSLPNNQLSGSIPTNLGNLSNLEYLELGANQLDGSIPTSLGNLTNLTRLYLYGNQLDGSIPTSLGNLTNLTWLHLDSNRLSGAVPPQLGNLSNLTRLYLRNNDLSGALPQSLTGITGLRVLRFAGNSGDLCAPDDAAFQAWLQAIPFRSGSNCAVFADRDVLIALYNATDGDNWSTNTNWLTDEPLGDWHGVGTDETGRVDRLDLGSNNLSGNIPSDLGNLSKLELLELGDNRLSGEIPPELGNLSDLEYLWLGSNDLTGEIPSELGSLSNLQGIGFVGNDLTGCVPDALRDVPDNDFEELGLPFCQELAALTALYNSTDGDNWMDNTNWLSDEPLSEWYGIFTNLNGSVFHIDLTGNGLSGQIPPELGNLSALTELALGDNDLSGQVPPELGNLSLRVLLLGDNDFSGCIPNTLGDTLSNDFYNLGLSFCSPRASDPADKAILETFYNATGGPNWPNSDNWLSDKPLSLWQGVSTDDQGRVIGLAFYVGNNLNGSIPVALGNLANLRQLILVNNDELSGVIPPQLGNLANLEDLRLRSNSLSDSIPDSLGNLASLEILMLNDNELSGPIPPELGNLADRLFWLRLSGNDLTGCVPDALQDISINDFDELGLPFCTAPSPAAQSDRAALIALYNATDGPNWTDNANWLSDEPLAEWSGVFTNDDGHVVGLTLLGNNLRGSVPTQLGSLANLTWLWLFGNRLSGDIPSELGSLTNLTWLDLGSNQLSGVIPPKLGSLTNLERLDLRNNQLSGMIPPKLGSLTNLERLDLRNNRLTGEIPSELGSLIKLQFLNLGNNRLTGEIPPELGNLPKLERLLVDENSISSITPLSEMTKLRVVRLHTNNVSDLTPLVANTELGSGAVIDVRINPLSDTSRSAHIPELKSRGVTVRHSPSRVNTDPRSSDSDRFIENADASIRIEYFFAPRPGEKRRDLARAQRTVDFLVELFGNRPSEPIVYEMTGRIRGDENKTWTRFRPQVTVPFEFQSDLLQVHEVAHVFTHYLLPTGESWFDEGISIQAEAVENQFSEGIIGEMSQYRYSNTQSDCLTPQVAPALARLKAGENVFADYPALVEICEIHWLNAHDTGQLFFMGLEEDYGMYGTKVQEFLGSLDRGIISQSKLLTLIHLC